jgi:hypothetical protein
VYAQGLLRGGHGNGTEADILTLPDWLTPSTDATSSSSSKASHTPTSAALFARPLLSCVGLPRGDGGRPALSAHFTDTTWVLDRSAPDAYRSVDSSRGGKSSCPNSGAKGSAAGSNNRLQVTVLPVVVWLCPQAVDRISVGITPMAAALAASGHEAPPVAAPATHQPSPSPACLTAPADATTVNSGALAAATPHKPANLELSVSVPHICVVARLPAVGATKLGDSTDRPSHTAAAAAAAAGGGTCYALLDVWCASHMDHVSPQRVMPHQGPPLLRCVGDMY